MSAPSRLSRWLRRMRCRAGLHHWIHTRRLTTADWYPPPWLRYIPPERHCLWCGKQEEWLPGYGGSELGCWQNKGTANGTV